MSNSDATGTRPGDTGGARRISPLIDVVNGEASDNDDASLKSWPGGDATPLALFSRAPCS